MVSLISPVSMPMFQLKKSTISHHIKVCSMMVKYKLIELLQNNAMV